MAAAENIELPSHPLSPLQHIFLSPSKESQIISSYDNDEKQLLMEEERIEKVLNEICDDALMNGVFITLGGHLRGQESDINTTSALSNVRIAHGGANPPGEPRPSIKIAISAGLSKKETDKASQVVKNSINKILKKRTQF